jgi:outer membrane protein insertion porin family
LVLLFCCLGSYVAKAETIKSIEVQGTKNITKETVLFYLGLNIGDTWNPALVNAKVKALHETGWFEDISVKIEQGHLVCTLKDNPIISEVIYKGNALLDSTIKKICSSRQGSFLSKESIAHDVSWIKKLYQSQASFLTKVTPKVDVQNDKAKITFWITEGKSTYIKNINIIGNKTFSSDHLRSKIISKMYPALRVMGYNPTYNLATFEQDKMLLERFYQSEGFLNVTILSEKTTISRSLDSFEVDFVLDEGTRYKLGDLGFQKENFPDSFVKKIPTYLKKQRQKQEFFNLPKIKRIAQRITNDLHESGYYDLKVTHQIQLDGETAHCRVVCKKEAQVPRVNKINIVGNKKTDERLIRKTLSIEEGSYYNSSAVEKSIKDLRNLGFFENNDDAVIISTKNIDNDAVEVNVEVVEKPTGYINLGLTGGTGGNSQIELYALEKNLAGTGTRLDLHLGGGSKNLFLDTQISKAVTKTSVIDFGISAKAQQSIKTGENLGNSFLGNQILVGKVDSDKAFSDVRVTAGIKNLLAKSTHLHTSLSLIQEKTDDKSTLPEEVSDYRCRIIDPGKYQAAQIQNALSYTFRDSNGERNSEPLTFDCSISHAYCYALSKGNDFHKFLLAGNVNLPILGRKLKLCLSANAGAIHQPSDERIRTQECFTLGEENMRGFVGNGCDPYVCKQGKRYSHGGDRYYRFSTELKSSLFFPEEIPVVGLFFFDCGNIWRENIKSFDESEIQSNITLRKSCGLGVEGTFKDTTIKLSWVLWSEGHKTDKPSKLHINIGKSF